MTDKPFDFYVTAAPSDALNRLIVEASGLRLTARVIIEVMDEENAEKIEFVALSEIATAKLRSMSLAEIVSRLPWIENDCGQLITFNGEPIDGSNTLGQLLWDALPQSAAYQELANVDNLVMRIVFEEMP